MTKNAATRISQSDDELSKKQNASSEAFEIPIRTLEKSILSLDQRLDRQGDLISKLSERIEILLGEEIDVRLNTLQENDKQIFKALKTRETPDNSEIKRLIDAKLEERPPILNFNNEAEEKKKRSCVLKKIKNLKISIDDVASNMDVIKESFAAEKAEILAEVRSLSSKFDDVKQNMVLKNIPGKKLLGRQWAAMKHDHNYTQQKKMVSIEEESRAHASLDDPDLLILDLTVADYMEIDYNEVVSPDPAANSKSDIMTFDTEEQFRAFNPCVQEMKDHPETGIYLMDGPAGDCIINEIRCSQTSSLPGLAPSKQTMQSSDTGKSNTMLFDTEEQFHAFYPCAPKLTNSQICVTDRPSENSEVVKKQRSQTSSNPTSAPSNPTLQQKESEGNKKSTPVETLYVKKAENAEKEAERSSSITNGLDHRQKSDRACNRTYEQRWRPSRMRKALLVHDGFHNDFRREHFSNTHDVTSIKYESLQHVLSRGNLIWKIKQLKPETVFIHLGFEDIRKNRSYDDILNDYKQLTWRIIDETAAKVCISTVIPIHSSDTLKRSIRDVNNGVNDFICDTRMRKQQHDRLFSTGNDNLYNYIVRTVNDNGPGFKLDDRGQPKLWIRLRDTLDRISLETENRTSSSSNNRYHYE